MEHRLEPINESHLPVLMASLLSGTDVEMCPGADRFIGYGDTKYGYGPACIVDIVSTDYVAEPHVTWFPWVTPKNMVINFTWAMNYLAQKKQVFLVIEKKESPFFEHFVKKGLLRKVGYLENIPKLEEVHMYQYKGGFNE